jgi:2'-5' RNA ligase
MAWCIAVTLDADSATAIGRLRSALNAHGTSRLAHPGAEPHISLAVVSDAWAPARLRSVLAPVASGRNPFRVTGGGYGLFTGRGVDSPVIHLAITRTPRLSALHDDIVQALRYAGCTIEGQYLPEHWRPHVTLADEGLTPRSIGAAMSFLAEHGPRRWTVQIDNVTLIGADDDEPNRLILGSAAEVPAE